MDLAETRRAAAAFAEDGAHCPLAPLGRGNINHTFLVSSSAGPFVLQRINERVFPEPFVVVENFFRVTSWLERAKTALKLDFLLAMPLRTLTAASHFRDEGGGCWRGQSYLPHRGISQLRSPGEAEELGRVLATFHRLASGLEGASLADPLPGFHVLPGYLQHYDRLVGAGGEGGAEELFCQRAVERHRLRALRLDEALRRGLVRAGVIHGDPKIDNVLFDVKGRARGLLDLDTVMVGPRHWDLGDCLRSCCTLGGEEGFTTTPRFSLEICESVLAGYGRAAASLFASGESDLVFDGLLAIAFELGLRFFTDHLRGDIYFRIRRPGDNLRRAARQFALVEDILAGEGAIRRVVARNLG